MNRTDEYVQLTEYLNWVNGVVGCTGVLLNACILVVLRRLPEGKFCYPVLKWLAVTDIVICVNLGVRAGVLRLAGMHPEDSSDLVCKVIFYTLAVQIGLEQDLVSLLTLERIVALSAPLFYRRHAGARNAHLACSGVVVICCLIALPMLFTHQVDRDSHKCSVVNSSGAKFLTNKLKIWAAMVWPVLFVTIGNVVIMYLLRKRRRQKLRITQPAEQAPKKGTTRMLLAICTTFSVCWVVAVLLSLHTSHHISTEEEWNLRYLLFASTNFIIIFNSCTNFFLYFLTNPLFKKHTMELIGL